MSKGRKRVGNQKLSGEKKGAGRSARAKGAKAETVEVGAVEQVTPVVAVEEASMPAVDSSMSMPAAGEEAAGEEAMAGETQGEQGTEAQSDLVRIAPAGCKPKALSCLDAAAVVLAQHKRPLRCKALIEAMEAGGLWHSQAPTPWSTLYSALLREINHKGHNSRFAKSARGCFGLNPSLTSHQP